MGRSRSCWGKAVLGTSRCKKKKKKEEGAAAVSTWNSVGTLTGVPAHPHHPNGQSARPECGLAPSTPSCLPLCSPLMTLFLVLPSCSPLRLPLSRSLSPEDRGAPLQPPPPAGSGPLLLSLCFSRFSSYPTLEAAPLPVTLGAL